MKNIYQSRFILFAILVFINLACETPHQGTDQKDATTETVSQGSKNSCSFYFGKGDANIDFLSQYDDSSSFVIEDWTELDFSKFWVSFQSRCALEKLNIPKDFQTADLFNGADHLQAEITEVFRSDGLYGKNVVLYGNQTYCILSYGLK